MVKTMGKHVVPLQPMKVHGRADIHMQSMEDPTPEQVDVPWRKLQPVDSSHWSRLLAGAVARGEEPMPRQVFWQDFWPMSHLHWSSLFLMYCGPWKGPTLEQFMKRSSLWEEPPSDQFVEDCLLWEGHHAGAGEESEEEEAAERTCDELTVTPIPHPPVPLGGKRGGKNLE